MHKLRKKILIIGRVKCGDNAFDGGEYGAERVKDIVQKCFFDYDVKLVKIGKISKFMHLRNIICGRSYGNTNKVNQEIAGVLKENIQVVFFNGSLYGGYVKKAAQMGVRTVVFYHNVEAKYYWDKYIADKTLLNLIMYYYVKKMESLSTRYADIIITLNKRDSEKLYEIYGRHANVVSPTSYDGIDRNQLNVNKMSNRVLLFVGSNFYANLNGIKHFIDCILPYIDASLKIVGNCCDSLKEYKDVVDNKRISLCGFVENIDTEYINATAVVCPIYLGSGMKTKTVEALKYGKCVFGTKEAFEGIECDYEKVGGMCNSDHEFVEKINKWLNTSSNSFNEYSYELFMNNYETNVVEKKFIQDVRGKLS